MELKSNSSGAQKRMRNFEHETENQEQSSKMEPSKKKTKEQQHQMLEQEKAFYDKVYHETTKINQETIKSLMNIYEKSQGLRLTYNMDIEIPEMVIVGSQSVGKSSIINALLGVQFNLVASEIGTVCPIIIRMENDPEYDEPFCMFFKDDVPDELESKETPIDQVAKEIEKRSQKRQLEEKSKISSVPIVMKIKYKECVNIVVYDTPGFRRLDISDSKDREQFGDENISQKIEDMVMGIISKQNKTIVALEQSSNEWCSMDIIDKIKKVDPELDRTIMIMTKFDQRSSSFRNPLSAQSYILNGINSLGIKQERFFLVSLPHKTKTVEYDSVEYLKSMKGCYLKDIIKMKLNDCDESHGIEQIGFVRARQFLQNYMIDQYKNNLHKMYDKFSEIILCEEEKLRESEVKLEQIKEVNVRELVLFNLSLFCSNIKHVLDGNIYSEGIDSSKVYEEYKIDPKSIGMTSIGEWKKYLEQTNNSEHLKFGSLEKVLWCNSIWKDTISPVDPNKKKIEPQNKHKKNQSKRYERVMSDSDYSSTDEHTKSSDTSSTSVEDVDDFSEILEEEKPKPKNKTQKHVKKTLVETTPINMVQVCSKFDHLKIKMSDQSIYGNNQFHRLLRECSLVIRSKIFPMSSTNEFNSAIPSSVHNHDMFESKNSYNDQPSSLKTSDVALENETKRIEQMKKFDPYICKIVQSHSKKCLMPIVEVFVNRLEFLIDHTIDVNMKFLNFYLEKKDVFMSHYKSQSSKNSWNQIFISQTSNLLSLIMRHNKNGKDTNVFNKNLNLKNIYAYFSDCVKQYKTEILRRMKDHMENELETMVNSLYELIQLNPFTIHPYIGRTDNSILYYMKWKDGNNKKKMDDDPLNDQVNSFLIEYVHHMNFINREPLSTKGTNSSSFMQYTKYFDQMIQEKPSISEEDQYVLKNCHMVFEHVKNEFINLMIRCYKNIVIDKMNEDMIKWLNNHICTTYKDDLYESMLGIQKKDIEKQLIESKQKIKKLESQRTKMNQQFV